MKDETKQELKELGLDGLENVTRDTVDLVFKALEVIIKDSENKIDDIILPTLPILKEKLLLLVDKIDGKTK